MPAQSIKRIVFAKICQVLREIDSLINQINVTQDDYADHVEQLCTNYFDLFSLFFTQHCQLTVRTMGYVDPVVVNIRDEFLENLKLDLEFLVRKVKRQNILL